MSRTRTIRSAGLAGAFLAIAGLPVAAQTEPPAMDAQVRVLHASPDAPPVDVYVDGAAVLEDFAFTAISPYVPLPAGDHRIQVFAAGADPAADTAVIDATLPFAAGSMTTVAATNALASIEAQVIPDAPAPVAEMAQVRVVHLSADAPAVDVANDGGAVVVPALAYPVATDYLTVPAGDLDLEIRPAGTTDVVYDIDALPLEAGTSYTAFAIGSLAGNSFQVLSAVDATLDSGM